MSLESDVVFYDFAFIHHNNGCEIKQDAIKALWSRYMMTSSTPTWGRYANCNGSKDVSIWGLKWVSTSVSRVLWVWETGPDPFYGENEEAMVPLTTTEKGRQCYKTLKQININKVHSHAWSLVLGYRMWAAGDRYTFSLAGLRMSHLKKH